MSIINTSIDSLNAIRSVGDKQYVLKGLSKQRIGFIVSGPDVGKGYLCLSIAYELATDLCLLNLKGSDGPLKTLYWPIEDGVDEVAKRMLSHLQAMPTNVRSQISDNVMLWDSNQPLCTLRNGSEVPGSENERARLIDACKGVDLLIIDTLREAAGNADEVDDDQVVKKILQDIAVQGDVAVLLVHHLTKAAIRGNEKVSNVSGSGFSRTQANSRMHLHLERTESKPGTVNPVKMTLSHIKANYISKSERLFIEPLKWTEESLLCLQSSKIDAEPHTKSVIDDIADLDVLKEIDLTLASRRIVEEVEPKEVSIGSVVLSESSFLKKEHQRKQDELVTDEDREQLRAWNMRRKRDRE